MANSTSSSVSSSLPSPRAAGQASPAAPTSSTHRVVHAVSGLRVVTGGRHTSLGLTVHLSKATTLVLTLRDVKARVLATWHKRLKAGTHRLSLPLSAKARHAGKDTLRFAWSDGSPAKTLPLTLAVSRYSRSTSTSRPRER